MGAPQVPAVFMPPSFTTTFPRHSSNPEQKRVLEHGCPVVTVALRAQVRETSSHCPLTHSLESRQGAPRAARGAQWLVASQARPVAQSEVAKQAPPAFSFGPHTCPLQRKVSRHSAVVPQVAPAAFRVRQMRCESQYESAAQEKLRQG